MTTVDLSTGKQGLVKFRNGQKLWTTSILPYGELFKVRIDSGKHLNFAKDGKFDPKDDSSPFDIVEFNASMTWKEAVKNYIPTEISLWA